MSINSCVFTHHITSAVYVENNSNTVNFKHHETIPSQKTNRQRRQIPQTKTLLINHSNFSGNTETSRAGGAIFVNNADTHLIIHNSSFKQNKAPTGGAIMASNTTITKSYFAFNAALEVGGGSLCFLQSSHILIQNTSFVQNTAPIGAAIAADDIDILTCNFCFFENNTVKSSG